VSLWPFFRQGDMVVILLEDVALQHFEQQTTSLAVLSV
jgi:hypothetical protein